MKNESLKYFCSHRTDHRQLSENVRKLEEKNKHIFSTEKQLSESSSAREELLRENKRLKMMIGLLKNKNELLLKAQKEKSPEDQSELEPGSKESSEENLPKCKEGDLTVRDSCLSCLNILSYRDGCVLSMELFRKYKERIVKVKNHCHECHDRKAKNREEKSNNQ